MGTESTHETGKIPNGFIIDLYKYLNTSPDDHEVMEQFYKDNHEQFCRHFGKREITYGNYDRIQLHPVEHFAEYTEKVGKTYNWMGTSQSIQIFPLVDDPNQRHFGWLESGKKTSLRIRRGKDKPFERMKGFMAASFCYISDHARSGCGNYGELLKLCSSQICQLVEAYNELLQRNGVSHHADITVEVFGTFCSAEIVILWSAEQYTDILYLVDCIRDIHLQMDEEQALLFRSTYTMISYPDYVKEREEEIVETPHYDENEILGKAFVQIGLQEDTSVECIGDIRQYFLDTLKKSQALINEDDSEPKFSMFNIAGEYDLLFETASKYLTHMFHKHGGDNFNIHNKSFNRFIMHTCTRLGYSTDEDIPGCTATDSIWLESKKKACTAVIEKVHSNYDKHWRSTIIQKLWNGSRKNFDELQDSIQKRFPSVSSFSATMDQLFSDYVQCCSTAADCTWIQDYYVFFEKMIQILTYYVTNNITEVTLEEMTRLVESVQQQINHISASNKLFFKEQNTHFGYTAQYDLVIHAYYGMIKELMSEIYRHETPVNSQSLLYPLIIFKPVYSIQSEMFIEPQDNGSSDDERIIVFRLPFDAMNNILHYVPMLIHEIYHYAAPAYRSGRNQILINIALFGLLKSSFGELFREAASEEIDKLPDDEVYLEDAMESFACTEFEDLFCPVLEECIRKNESGIFKDISRYYQPVDGDMALRSWLFNGFGKWVFLPGHVFNYSDADKETDASFEKILEIIIAELERKLEEETAKTDHLEHGDVQKKLFAAACRNMLSQIKKSEHEFMQEVLKKTDVVYDDEVKDLFSQMDELLPDCAMVRFSGMSISGYLLQVAIDHDSNFFTPEDLNESDALRYGVILEWLLAEFKDSTFEAELELFCKRYIEVYRIHSLMNFDEENIRGKVSQWKEYFNICFKNIYKTNYGRIKDRLMEMLNNHILSVLNEPDNQFSDVFKKYMNILDADVVKQQDMLFKANLDTIMRFQDQKLISEINMNLKPAVAYKVSGVKKAPPIKESEYVIVLSDFNKRNSQFDWVLQRMYEYRRQNGIPSFAGIWYRGIENAEFSILPSGLVHFAEDCEQIYGSCRVNENKYLYCQRHLYEEFRYAADSAPEHQNPAFYTPADHLALMQHYTQHSNLLDWSQDIDTALYFALESEIIANGSYRKVKPGKEDPSTYKYPDKDAAIYFLDPIMFNYACAALEKDLCADGITAAKDTEKSEIIPNLSIAENKCYLDEYYDFYNTVPSDEWIELKKGAVKRTWDALENEEKKLNCHLPRAVYVSKLNPRVNAQSGLFIAYSLLSSPAFVNGEDLVDPGKTDLFRYQAVEELQNLYLKKGGRVPFLFKFIVPAGLKKQFGEHLNRLGFTKERFYPEIQHHKGR